MVARRPTTQQTGPTTVAGVDTWWAAFADHATDAGLFVDFDGTLAHIVDDPATARPLPGVVDLLSALSARLRTVAVVSGRPVEFLAAHLDAAGVVLSGQYGLEEWRDGERLVDPQTQAWQETVAAVADRAEEELPAGIGVERKGLSVTLHVRVHPEHEAKVKGWAEGQATATGLVVHPARRSWELRPPVTTDKGTVVAALAAGLQAVCFIGDDRGDLPAFAVLDELAGRSPGIVVRKVAVASEEAPPELLLAADRVVDGPSGALASCANWPTVFRTRLRPRCPRRRPRRSHQLVLGGSDLVVEPVARSAPSGCGADRSRVRGAVGRRHRQSRSEHIGRPGYVERVDLQRRAAELVPGAGLADKASTPSRRLISGPSLATRLRPSRRGLTSRTSYRWRAATDATWLSEVSSSTGFQVAEAQVSLMCMASVSTSLR